MAVFVDITDLYYKLLKKFGSGKLNYAEYLAKCREISGQKDISAVAYGCQEDNEAGSFIRYLRSIGFLTKYKRPYTLKIGDREIKRCNWVASIAVDTFKSVFEDDDTNIILGSSNPDIIPLVKFLKEKGVTVTIFSCNIPKSLCKLTNCVDITEDLLENEHHSNGEESGDTPEN